MATTRITYSLPPNIDVTKAPVAFGRRAIPKLNHELVDPLLITRQRALMSLSDLIHDPEKIYSAVKQGCIENLKYLLCDKDGTVRHKTTEVLCTMVSHQIGRTAFLKHDVIEPLAKLFEDELEVVRKNVHSTIEMLSEMHSGAMGIVNAGLIPKLGEKLKTEIDVIKHIILDTLHFCMRVHPYSALDAGVLAILKELLEHKVPEVRGAAARDIMDISVPLEGKKAACKDAGIIPVLVHLLYDRSDQVKTNAAGALMNIAIITTGKYASLKAGSLAPLLKLVEAPKSETRLYALKTLTMLAEAPEGRSALASAVPIITTMVKDPKSRAVARAAQIAIKVITWKP